MLSFLVLWESNVKPFTAILQCRLLPVTIFIEMQDCNLQSNLQSDIFGFVLCFIQCDINSEYFLSFLQPEILTFVTKVTVVCIMML